MGRKQAGKFPLDLAKCAAFPYKPAAIDPENASLYHPGLNYLGPLGSAAGVMNAE
jgi:hypothetical protein